MHTLRQRDVKQKERKKVYEKNAIYILLNIVILFSAIAISRYVLIFLLSVLESQLSKLRVFFSASGYHIY